MDTKIILLFLILFCTFSFAQKQNIKGFVTDAQGNVLAGVSVLVKDKKVGTQTDFDGMFEVNAGAEDTLVFSYMGMVTKEVAIGSINLNDELKVVLKEDSTALDEVVISTGYQKKDVKTLTGSVVELDVKRIKNRPTARVQDLLAGMSPGLLVTRSNPGRLGGGSATITSQGGGFRGGGNMLIVIDGLPQPGNFNLTSINPQDIASINILRDSEAVVYGARASNGVIVVTTKQGEMGKQRISVTSSAMIKMPSIVFKPQNIVEYVLGMEEAWDLQKTTGPSNWPKLLKYIKDNDITTEKLEANNGKPLSEIPLLAGAPWPDVYGTHMMDLDWTKLFYGPAIDHQHNISFSGGVKNKGIRYYVNIGNTRENSLMKYGNNNQNNLFGNAKIDFQLKKWITMGMNINTSFIKNIQPANLPLIEERLSARTGWGAAFDEKERPLRWGGFRSPIALAKDGGEIHIRANRFQGQVYTNITPIKDLNVKLVAQQSFFNYSALTGIKKAYDYRLNNDKKEAINAQTSVSRLNILNRFFNATATINYKLKFKEIHKIKLFGLYSHEEFDYTKSNVKRVDRLTETVTSLNLTSTENQTSSDEVNQETITGLSFNLRYTLLDKYTLEGYIRRDGSSRFATGHKFANFYGGGVSYNLSDEDFFKNLVPKKVVSKVKLRFTYGIMANRNGIGYYDFAQNVNINQSGILFGTAGNYSKAQQATLGNPSSDDRTWVNINKRNFGFDIGFLNKNNKDRLTIRADIYTATTNNGFYREDVPTSFGATMPAINGAKYENNGWDFQINWQDEFRGLSYGISAGLSDNVNKVVSLPDSRTIVNGLNRWVEGEEVNTYYGLDFTGLIKSKADLDDYKAKFTSGLPIRSDFGIGDAMYADTDGDGKLELTPYKIDKQTGKPKADSGDLIRLKSTNPHYYYFINLNAAYKGFSFSVIMNGIGQWYVYDSGRPASYAAPWVTRDKYSYKTQYHPTNRPDSNIPRFYTAGTDWNTNIANWNYRISDGAHVMKNVGYLRIQNIQLAYELPKKIVNAVGLDRVNIFSNIQDPGYLINKMTPSFSPEQPFSRNIAPYITTYSIGVNIDL